MQLPKVVFTTAGSTYFLGRHDKPEAVGGCGHNKRVDEGGSSNVGS